MLGSVKIPSARFQYAACDINIIPTEVLNTPSKASQSNDGWCNLKLCQFTNKSSITDAAVYLLLFLPLGKSVELLLQFSH